MVPGMKAVTYAQLRRGLPQIMDRAADDHDPVIVTRSKGEAMVLMSLEDFEAYRTTLHLMGTPEKRAALEAAMDELERGERVDVAFDEAAGVFKPIKAQGQAAE